MNYAGLMILVALAVLLASPAFPQSPETSVRFTPRPVTITTAGGRSYVVGIQRQALETIETAEPTPPIARREAVKGPAKKAPSLDKD
jgi:hypothetical protein